jgi:hypothetical protein
MSDFNDCLEDWKARERHDDALILLQDNSLLKFAGLWRASLVTRVNSYVFDSEWLALWECVTINYAEFADLADETENRTRFQVRRLRELRLIYPDGSRTAMATNAIVKFMADRLA